MKSKKQLISIAKQIAKLEIQKKYIQIEQLVSTLTIEEMFLIDNIIIEEKLLTK